MGWAQNAFPEDTFWPLHNLVMKSLEGEGIHFSAVHIDRTFPKDNAPTRKPATGMLTQYLNNPAYDIGNFVCDRRSHYRCTAGQEPGLPGHLAEPGFEPGRR